jgi:pimeloyl-ACP methyl ester carboxylesterase
MLSGQIAQQQNGTTIVLEHRFFGLSNPKPDLSVDSLRLLNLQQATADLAYFAQNVVLPQPGGDQLKPNQAPWILVGGSYSGALTSWTMVRYERSCIAPIHSLIDRYSHPGVFFAGYASSGVVEAIVYALLHVRTFTF